MALYCIGDLQGCNAPFQQLLEKIDFSPSRDTLYLLGDLVNRGPDSLGTLRGPDLKGFLTAMYGNTPSQWADGLQGADRLRVIVNALTRLRFCTAHGAMEFGSNEGAGSAPQGFLPWFVAPGRATQNDLIVFGHWSTLVSDARRHDGLRNNTLPLDTGCVWGGCLTAARLGAGGAFELIQVDCEQAQKPGK